jgi:hypothetical protein
MIFLDFAKFQLQNSKKLQEHMSLHLSFKNSPLI